MVIGNKNVGNLAFFHIFYAAPLSIVSIDGRLILNVSHALCTMDSISKGVYALRVLKKRNQRCLLADLQGFFVS